MNRGDQIADMIETLDNKIDVAGDSGDLVLMNKLMNIQIKFLKLIMPYIKKKEDEKRPYPNLKAALDGMPPEVLEQILTVLEG